MPSRGRQGRPASAASDNHLKFTVEGAGEIVATDNGDATSFESFQASDRNAFNDLALVVVRAKPGQAGAITLKAESSDLKPATIRIKSASPTIR
jgi:beta-galactosidase